MPQRKDSESRVVLGKTEQCTARVAAARAAFLADLDAVAKAVAAAHPGLRVGFTASAVDNDFAIYLNGPAAILGHGPEDVEPARQDLLTDPRLSEDDCRCYAHGARATAGGAR